MEWSVRLLIKIKEEIPNGDPSRLAVGSLGLITSTLLGNTKKQCINIHLLKKQKKTKHIKFLMALMFVVFFLKNEINKKKGNREMYSDRKKKNLQPRPLIISDLSLSLNSHHLSIALPQLSASPVPLTKTLSHIPKIMAET